MTRDKAIAAALERVAQDVEFPETPPLAETVRRRIEAGPMPVGTIRLPRTRPSPWRPIAVGVSVVVVALAVTLSLSVTAREAVADLLGVVGIRITFDEGPEVSPPSDAELRLGTRVGVAAASERAGFDVVLPHDPVVEGLRPAVYF
ncbi:MAG: hypothetical protein M3271_12165, partial [Actinomycetota bacterium]|nr:hypothetical protein [Actinomycetota bacterium]